MGRSRRENGPAGPPSFRAGWGFMAGSVTIKGDILEPISEKWDVEDDL